MSEWNRYGRDDNQRRYRAVGRDPRDLGREDSYGQHGDWHDEEQRSFGAHDQGSAEWRNAEAQRRYGMSGGHGRQDYGGGDYGEQPRSASAGYGQDYRQAGNRDDQRLGPYGGLERSRGQEYEQSRQGQTIGRRNSRGRDTVQARELPYSEGGGVLGGNPNLQRITDGDTGRHFFGYEGEHRGRGPKNYTRSDERIREDVNDRLTDDSWLDASEIEVQAKDGEITLSGTVENRDAKRRAEDLAEQVSGVKHVQNNLRIQQQQQPVQAAQNQAGQTGAANGRSSS